MQFLYPYFLWTLTALAVPVIIHLFYFKRFKKVYFSNVKYLKEIKEETSNRNKLKELLILLSRLLAFTALIFAFAQPFIPTGKSVKEGNQLISIFVDNSYSMTSSKEDIPLVDHAKERARRIVLSYGDETKYQIITMDLLGKHQRFLSKEDALTYLDEIQPTSLVQPLSKVLLRQYQLLRDESGNKSIYHISDFQENIFDYENVKDSLAEVNLLPVQTNQVQNVSIDSVWMENQVAMMMQPNKILVKLTNNAPQSAEEVRLSILQDGQEKPVSTRSIEPGSSVTDTVPVVLKSRGVHKLNIKITDYPVQFDDEYFVVLNVPDTIIALNIYDGKPNPYLNALFEGLSYFGIQNQSVSQIQYQTFSKYNLIILQDIPTISSGLAGELTKYMKDGGKVVLFPSTKADPRNYNNFLQSIQAATYQNLVTTTSEVSRINTEEFIFKDVFTQIKNNIKLPKTTTSFSVKGGIAGENILTNRDGSVYLGKYKAGNGILYLCSSSLSEEVNDLVKNAEIFVPMLYKMALSGIGNNKISHTISNKTIVETKSKELSGDRVFKMKGKTEFIPGQKILGNRLLLDVGDQIRESGFYDVLSDDKVIETVAFNYDRQESNMKTIASGDILSSLNDNPLGIRMMDESEQADMSNSISTKDKGITLWKYFLLAALFFLLLETLLIRLWRKA